jgi:hypothetical protein
VGEQFIRNRAPKSSHVVEDVSHNLHRREALCKRPFNALAYLLDVMLCSEPLIEPEADAVDVPGQELCDAVDGMIGDALDHLPQIGLGIEAVRLGGLCRSPNYAECYLARPDSSGFRWSSVQHSSSALRSASGQQREGAT